MLTDVHQKSIALLHRVTPHTCAQVLDVIPSLLSSSTLLWPHRLNTWFLGHTPIIHHLCPLLSSHILCALSQLWHILFIHLAARIWGCVQRLSALISCLLLFFLLFSFLSVFFVFFYCSPTRMTQCSHTLAVFTTELAKLIVLIVLISAHMTG